MHVVMGGESLVGEKTGVGQYTEQLATRLKDKPDVSDFKFLAHGKLFTSQYLLGQSADNNQSVAAASLIPDSFARIRGALSQNIIAVWCYWNIMRWLDRYSLRKYGKRDIYHSPNYMLPIFPGKRVVTILDLSTIKHQEFHPKARVKLLNLHIENAIKKADHIVTISDFIRREIIEHFGVSENKITTTHLAASEGFIPLTEHEFSNKISFVDITYKKYFLFASTIEPRKNISRLLDAYTMYYKREGKNALPLIIVGHPGWHSDTLHQRIKGLERSSKVRYLGYVQQTQMPVLFAGARALLFPSIYEGFGLPVLEAMQAGTAVLTSRDSAMSEVAGDAALLVSPTDTKEIWEKTCELSSNDELVQQLTIKGLARSHEFSWTRCADQTHLIYQKLTR